MPILVSDLTELSTAATDFILSLSASCCVVALRIFTAQTLRRQLWQGLFVSLSIASALGAVAHGIRMSDTVNRLLWHPLYFLLALTVTLLAVIAIRDLYGDRVAMKYLRGLLPAPCIVVVLTWLGGGAFIWFILFEAVAMLFVLVVYLYLFRQNKMPGSGLVLCGVLLSMAAALLQATGPFTFQLIWMFDHNGLFHLVQLPGVACFCLGALKNGE